MYPVLLFTIILYSLWQISEAYYATNTHERMKHKIMTLETELIYDSVAKRASIDWMKRYYSRNSVYHLAEVCYGIKRKYSRMVFIYMRAADDYENEKTTIQKLLEFLIETQHLNMDIDNMIQMLEEWEDKDTRKKRITRTGPEIDETLLQEPSRKSLELTIEKQKQKDYIERKKILWSMAQGSSRQNLRREHFKKRNNVMEGFDYDLNFN